MNKALTAGPEAVPNTDYSIFMLVMKGIFVAAYAQGQFDQANGFNTSTSLEALASKWIKDHAELFQAPINVERLLTTLGDEAKEDRRLTDI